MGANTKTVHRIREFNRFYLPALSLLGNHYLNSEYSVTEARVFFEIYENEGCNAAYIEKSVNIDKSYLSRIIRAHERSGFIKRFPSEIDGRSFNLHLTEEGSERTEALIQESDAQIGRIIASLSDSECRRLEKAMDTIKTLISRCMADR